MSNDEMQFGYNSQWDEDCYKSFMGLVKKQGFWVSDKQAAYVYRLAQDSDTFYLVDEERQSELKKWFNVEAPIGSFQVSLAGWVSGNSESWGRKVRSIDWCFIVDEYGIQSKWRLYRKYDDEAGSSHINPSKTKREFLRTPNPAFNAINAIAVLTQREAAMSKAYQERAARDAASQFYGEIGTRYDLTLNIEFIKPIDGMYGRTYLHKMRDEQGNVFKTFCSNVLGQEGETVSLRGTVKSHDLWNEARETNLTRCKAN